MFKGMHPAFWIGIAVMYGLTLICWLFEINLPGSVFEAKIGGAAAPFYYGNIFIMLVVNIFLAWLWYYLPEKNEKEKEQLGKGAGKGVTS